MGNQWRSTGRILKTVSQVPALPFSRNGEAIIQGIDEIGSFDWLPDNRLVYTFGQKLIAEIERNTFRSRTIADMSSIEGIPGRVAVSTDGNQVLFEMITDASSFYLR